MLWEDLEPGDKLMFNPEWVRDHSKKYGWWNSFVWKLENTKLTIKQLRQSKNSIFNLTITFKECHDKEFSIKKDTGRIWNHYNNNDSLPLFKIVELKDD